MCKLHFGKRLIGAFIISILLLQIGSPLFITRAADESVTVQTTTEDPSYTKLREIDKGTFNEYRFRITEAYFTLREKFSVDSRIDIDTVTTILELAGRGYRYLPDNLINKNKLNELITEGKKAVKYPDNDTNYSTLVKAIRAFLEETDIKTITGTIEASPKTGNAPLTVTFRGKVTDPTGTQIPSYNYIWWIDNGGRRDIIGRQLSLNYTFQNEGNYTVFLDVVSNHKNENGLIDVLPFSSRVEIKVQEKIASLSLKVNGDTLGNQDVLKFNPDEGRYGLIFDATSSTPTSGTRFTRTEWDFGNGVKRSYNGAPKVERIVYATEGNFPVTLKLQTNELKTIERQFDIAIHKPAASIQISTEEGFIGDKFTVKAKPSGREKDLSFDWEIEDIERATLLRKKEGNTFTETFANKGKYNIKLKITDPTGNTDVDSKIIYINSRAPVAEFSTKVQRPNRPNTIVFDASKSYDPDYTDDGNLTFNWIIDGERVNLEGANKNGSVGYYTFSSIGDHSVVLEVVDPSGISAQKKSKVTVNSVLSVDLFTFPRAIQREQFIRFEADAENATFFEWDFGDGEKSGGKDSKVNHVYKKAGMFDVKVTVRDSDGGTNTDTKKVYVGNSDSPVALLDIAKGTSEEPLFDKNACGGKGAYKSDKVTSIRFDAEESIDITGEKTGLSYSWKIGNEKYSTARSVNHTFDEIGCFPVKLTVKSDKNGKTDTQEALIQIENVAPVLSSLQVTIADPNTDPVVVSVSAIGAKDLDGVIQNYLWYYYSDTNADPQDFRATTTPKTTFVLPKVTGNYYFVLVMKDNNEAKVNSEEISGQKYSITLAGDNVNTPIIDLKVNDSSVSVGDDVVFTAQTKNILGQDLSNKADYYWDFDGDGFYDKQTKESSISYKYTKAGEFFAKVKVKHKGFTNTRNLQINVINNIVPDFSYISIGNKYIFLNTSEGKPQSIKWSLGDGNTLSSLDPVTHIYTDGKNTHLVEMTISDGTKSKKVTKKVVPEVKNIIKARKEGLNIFSYPTISEDGKMLLEKAGTKPYIYLGESKGEAIAKYTIDYNTAVDSDLNGGKDDDEDFSNSGAPMEIPLGKMKSQKMKVSIKDITGTVLESKEIEVIQTYITDTQVDASKITFAQLSEDDKRKIEKVKTFISALQDPYKNEGLRLLEKLQEEWPDENERVKTLLEIETFFDNPEIKNADPIIDILQSILVSGQDDKSQKNIAFNALRGLIPDDVTGCTMTGSGSCKEAIIAKLELIKTSDNLESNKKIGTEILTMIGSLQGMTNKEKVDFKAVLKTFVYGGVENIPDEEKQEVTNETTSETSSDWGIMNILINIAYILGAIIFAILLILLGFFLYFKITGNSREETSFRDFILKKTGGNGDTSSSSNPLQTTNIDVLSEVKPEKSIETPVLDPLATNVSINISQKTSPVSLASEEQVPDWLKGASDIVSSPAETKKEEVLPVETKEEVMNTEQSPIPDINKVNVAPVDDWNLKVDANSSLENKEGEQVPDWLKGAFDENSPSLSEPQDEGDQSSDQNTLAPKNDDIQPMSISEEDIKPTLSTETEISSQEDLTIPDWLKGSFDADTTNTKADEKEVIRVKDDTSSELLNDSYETTDEDESSEDVVATSSSSSDTPTKKRRRRRKKSNSSQDQQSVSPQNSPTPDNSSEDGLWQDGMKIPDWLQDNPPTDDKKTL